MLRVACMSTLRATGKFYLVEGADPALKYNKLYRSSLHFEGRFSLYVTDGHRQTLLHWGVGPNIS